MNTDIDRMPFPNVGNNVFYNKEFCVANMLPMMGSTKGWGTPLANADILDVIDKTNKEIAGATNFVTESDIKEREIMMRNPDNIVNEMFDNLFDSPLSKMVSESSEKGNPDIPDMIEPIVNTLENKGYQVKYSSPGHMNTIFNNDRNKDKVINGKLTTTARVIFSKNYKFANTPEGWEWKVLNNNVKALYVKPFTYMDKDGSPKEAFAKWRERYINALSSWAKSLPKAGEEPKDTKEDENFN